MTQTVTTTRTPHQGYTANRGTPQNQGYASSNTPQEQGYALRNNAAPQHQEYSLQNNNTPQGQDFAARNNTTPQGQEFAVRNNNTRQHQNLAPRNSSTSQSREYAPRNNAASIRPVDEESVQNVPMSQPYRGNSSSNPRFNAYDSPNRQDEDDADLARQNSIPRKKIGTSANTSYSPVQALSHSKAQTGHSRQQSAPKPLPATPAAASYGHTDRQNDSTPQPSSILNRSRPVPTSEAGIRDAQDVVDRAKTNTYDTQVVETVAPGQFQSRVVNP